MRVDGSRIRKEKVADSKISGYVWAGPECRKVIGFALSTKHDWLKNLRHFFIQSEVKPKPMVKRAHTFSRALCQLHVITSSLTGSLYCLCPL